MHIRTLLLLIVLGAIAAFATVNWNSFMTPTNLSLLFATIQAPLGLIMLGFTALLTALFLLFIAYLQASLLMDTRRHTREMQAQRALTDQAEASRITELRKFLESELLKIAEQPRYRGPPWKRAWISLSGICGPILSKPGTPSLHILANLRIVWGGVSKKKNP